MKHTHRIAELFERAAVPAALAATLLTACTSEEPPASGTAAPAGEPSAVPSVEEAAAALETVPPTEAEAEAAAAESITAENADAEFEKLRQEIEAGGGG